MSALARELVDDIRFPEIIYLAGELGAGKTTLVREILQALGHQGAVKSPTYTLYETYHLTVSVVAGRERLVAHHFDLYRLNDPDELEYIGLRDLLDADLIMIEWPDRGGEQLPEATLAIEICYAATVDQHGENLGRDVIISRVE